MKNFILKWLQPIKFAMVGCVNTVSSLLIYYLLLYLHMNYMLATVVGYLGSSVIGYFLNKIWVFDAKKTKVSRSLFRYYIVYGSSLCLNLACMYLWIQILGISETIAPVLTLCITIPYNYLFSRFWIFK